MIKENLEFVEENITRACEKAGRSRDEVTLIAVSKTKPVEMIQEFYDLGQRSFGENRVQELTEKMPQLPDDISWHLIGHLQKNKVKYIVGKVSLIHSCDSLELASVISKESVKHGVISDVLIEVNMAEEESKFGTKASETEELIRQISAMENVRVKGLMTVAPFVEDPEENRAVFRKMKELSVDIESKRVNNVSMSILSMGMTNDFEVAIEEGATMVRIGTALFGMRNYNK